MEHLFPIPSKRLNSDIFKTETGFDLYQRGEELIVNGDCTQAEAQAALDAHNPPAPIEPTVAEKLASVGLSLEELREALGSN
jgi:hypothetical protein